MVAADDADFGVQGVEKLQRHTAARTDADADHAAVEQAVLADPAMQRHLEHKTVHKVIIVPGRLVNVVAG